MYNPYSYIQIFSNYKKQKIVWIRTCLNFHIAPACVIFALCEDGDTDKLRSGNFKPDLLYYLHVIEKNEGYYVFTSYIFRDIFFFNFNGE